jgi:outer membrane protein OmpA-like peptidoglycan-associated protein
MKYSSQWLSFITFSLITSLTHADTGYYIGADLGASYLKPDVSNTGYSNEKNTALGYGVLGGFNWSPRSRIEAQYHKLGTAEVALNRVINEADYDVYNFDVQYDLWQNQTSQFFGSIGLTALDATSDAPIEKENSTNIKLGAGYEYFINDNWSTRVAYSQLSGDASYLSVGLNRHFGRNIQKTEPVPVVEVMPEPELITEAIVKTPQDQDQDGVMDDQDACPNTVPTLKVDQQGCSIVFDYSFPDINFEFNSAKLTQSAQRKLDEIAYEFKKIADLKVEVQAHTDSIGSNAYNIELSNKRAVSIVNYLVLHGIFETQLIPKGYGETKPIADNKTDRGRALNRRAEFKLIR